MATRPRSVSVYTPPDTGDSTLDRALYELQEAQRRAELPFAEGRQVDNVEITAGTRARVAHGLGRTLRGWWVVRRSANSVVYDEQTSNNFQDRELWLQASATVVVSIWVY